LLALLVRPTRLLRSKNGMKSSGICDLGYRAFRGSYRFTANQCVPKARASLLVTPVKSALP
jgi:hypothetical protein